MTAHRFSITATHLSDGRELFYFDDSEPYCGEATRTLIDSRNLPPAKYRSELRRDPLTGEWVINAAHRMQRDYRPRAVDNPLAPSQPGRTPTEIPADDYDVVVYENTYPALSRLATLAPGLGDHADAHELVPRQPANGRCEVVCFTPNPDLSVCDLPLHRIRTIIEAWTQRTAALSAMPAVAAVFPFENRGEDIGVTLHHPHGQIYAYPWVPPRLSAIVESARQHRATHGTDLFDAVLASEKASGERVIRTGEFFTIYVPAAAKWPLEIILMPHRPVADFTELTDPEKTELAAFYRDILRRFDRFFPGVSTTPYIAAWNQAPVGTDRDLMRLHLQLISPMRAAGWIKHLAGSELGMGVWVNDTTPELIASRLRAIAEEPQDEV